ncbi:MAG: hypothetical protein UT13_C0001G0708 [Candidatus Pacebacteria bacterium GW2011_GWF2_38_9]|nr:MAG: hypothetical protein US01_C0001G0740 [candidate division TM6 bacterium GW2011_GWF2_28_16]KKQ10104.1 MAG: hypothetical protein US20_C0003G0044 [Candidatus Pacebacteria bacterium GW2011_GWF1_36_5]KKQ89060.1 MAG: hypothetical protein UT13_C0001G0708 [Candidatus Pacebacteria bacterium GW2011_GWF2_38_9]HAZ73561.1 hypothetical protein [Candidatus Paceibacterota bacterium]
MNSKLSWLAKFKEKNNLELIRLLLFFFIIFTFSINLFYKISLDGTYVRGLLVDYLIPKIYLAEIFLIPFLILEFNHLKKIKMATYGCLLILFLLIRQLLSQNPLAAFTHLIHFTELFLFFIAVSRDPLFKSKMAAKFSLGAMFLVVIFQSLLAFYQFFFQKSLLAYHALGETNLQDFANISKAQFFFGEKILPYGTTPHPNILAGLVVVFSILIILKIKGSLKAQLILLANALLIIFLTQSISALLTLVLFGVYLIFQRIKVKRIFVIIIYYFFLLLLPFLLSKISINGINQDSVNRRVALNQASLEMFKDKMLFGVGINNFTLNLENYSTNGSNREVIRFVQPVHNLLFLVLSEGGLLLLIIIFLLIKEAKIDGFYRKSIILLAIASLDHYLLSQFSGISLLALFYLFI